MENVEIADIKLEIKKRGLDTEGQKSDLIYRLQTAVSSNSTPTAFVSAASSMNEYEYEDHQPLKIIKTELFPPIEDPVRIDSVENKEDDIGVHPRSVPQLDGEIKDLQQPRSDVEPLRISLGETICDSEGTLAFDDGNSEHSESDSDDEDDDGVIVLTSDFNSTNQTPLSKKRIFEKGSNSYVRPESFTLSRMSSTETTESEPSDLSNLRFAYGKTAFDSDIDNLSEKPWRKPRVDLSDFFNYGFTEATWKVYSERQLHNRIAQGFGPALPPPAPVSLQMSDGTPSKISL